jgi:hypothetical protein
VGGGGGERGEGGGAGGGGGDGSQHCAVSTSYTNRGEAKCGNMHCYSREYMPRTWMSRMGLGLPMLNTAYCMGCIHSHNLLTQADHDASSSWWPEQLQLSVEVGVASVVNICFVTCIFVHNSHSESILSSLTVHQFQYQMATYWRTYYLKMLCLWPSTG